MKLETFFEKFDQFADAPDAVAKMRELVLHLAVTGNLVGQDPSDESGELLLKKINAERLAAVKARQISPMKPLPAVGEDEQLLELQPGWAAARLIELVMEIQTGPFGSSLHKSDYQLGGTPVINPASLKDGKIVPIDEMAIGHATLKRLEVFKLCSGDIVMARRGEMGRCAIVTKNEEGWLCGTGSLVLRMPRSLYAPYLAMLIGAPMARTYLGGASVGTTMQNLNQSILAKMPVGVPPLAEQKRIVAKVDELMALCDRLEAQQQERETRHAVLARASLSRFADAPTPANLHFLFHPSYTISPADLRKSILTLAVQGKLVPQDPNDEPAEDLLARVASALPDKKSENPFLGEIETSITDESQYELPSGWVWLPLGHVGIWATGCGFPMQYQGETDGEFLFCKVSDMNLPGNEVEIHTTVHKIDADVMKKIRARANPVGTVIFPKIGGAIATHKRRFVIKPTIIDNNCSGIQPIGLTDDSWLLLFLRNLDLTKYQSGTSVPAVSQGSLDPIRIGLPPLAEQRRIVAKVSELMALVDALETQLATSCATAENLLAAIVAELTEGTHSSPAC